MQVATKVGPVVIAPGQLIVVQPLPAVAVCVEHAAACGAVALMAAGQLVIIWKLPKLVPTTHAFCIGVLVVVVGAGQVVL